jgi:hypothetical protein
VDPQPDHTETSPSQKTNSFEILGKTLPKFGVLVSSEVWFNIEGVLIFISVIDFQGFFLIVFRLVNIVVSFLKAVDFFLLFGLLLFFTIK